MGLLFYFFSNKTHALGFVELPAITYFLQSLFSKKTNYENIG